MFKWLMDRLILNSDLYLEKCKEVSALKEEWTSILIKKAVLSVEHEKYIENLVKQLATHGLYIQDGDLLTEAQFNALVSHKKRNLKIDPKKEGEPVRFLFGEEK